MRTLRAKAAVLAIVLASFVCVLVIGSPAAGEAISGPHAPAALDFLTDDTSTLTIDDVAAGAAAARFRPVGPATQSNARTVYWYRFTPPRTAAVPLIVRLREDVGDADLYFRKSGREFALVRFGIRVPFAQRVYPVAWPATPLTADMLASGTLYLRTSGYAGSISIEPESSYAAYRADIARITFGFASFFASIGFLSLFMWITLRERSYGLQALLMAVAIVYTLTENELAWEYLWPTLSVDYGLADAIAFIGYLLTLLLFVRSFLSLPAHLPWLDRLLWVIFGLNVALTVAINPIAGESATSIVAPIVNFSPFPLMLIAAIVRWRSGFAQARFFVVGFGTLMVIFALAGIFDANPITRWGFDLGVAFDSMFFQFALADRLISANRARDEAQSAALAAEQLLVESQSAAIAELQKHNAAVTRFVPREFLEQLGRKDVTEIRLGDHVEREMTVLFSDIRSFVSLSETMTPKETFAFINGVYAEVGPIVRQHGGFVDKYIGDAVMGLFDGSTDDAIEAAVSLQQGVRRLNERRARALREPIAFGVGLHRGTLVLGTIGEERRLETTVIADAVNVAARLQELTKAFGARIIASEAVFAAAKHSASYRIRPLAKARVRGLSRQLTVYEVCDADEPEVLLKKMATLDIFEAAVRSYDAGDFAKSEELFAIVVESNPHDLPAAYGLTQSTVMRTTRTIQP